MKLILFLTIAFTLQASADVLGQKVSLSVRNESLKTVLKELRKQSQYSFMYKDRDLESLSKVSLQVQEEEILQVLPILFDNLPLAYTINGKIISIQKKAEHSGPDTTTDFVSEERTLEGTVRNEKGELLAGASVYVLDAKGKRTSVQTVTQADGSFRMPGVAKGTQLEITFLGYASIKITPTGDRIDVALTPLITEVDAVEVVNTGYQTLPKERATGSFSYVGTESINLKNGSNILDRLENMATGLYFNKQDYKHTVQNTKQNYLVRGYSTILSSNEPLLVVDGFPYDGNVLDINPNDVKDVTILKDAAASSIWGARAGNGVIVISTHLGSRNKSTRVKFSQMLQYSQKPNLYKDPVISSADFIELEKFLFNDGFYNAEFTKASKPAVTPVVQMLYDQKLGRLTEGQLTDSINTLKMYDTRDEFLKHLYRKPFQQQYNLSVNGGNQQLSYYFGGGYDKDMHTLKANQFERISFLNNNSLKLGSNFDLQSNIAVNVNSDHAYPVYASSGYGNIRMGIRKLYPYAKLVDTEGNYLPIPAKYRQSYLDELSYGNLLNWNYNPLQEVENTDLFSKSTAIKVGLKGLIKLNDAFELSTSYQFLQFSEKKISDYLGESFYARDLINRYSTINPNGTLTKNIPEGGIRDNTHSLRLSNSFRTQLNYQKNIGTEHSLTGLVGGEIREIQTEDAGSRLYGYDHNTGSFQLVDYVTRHVIFDKLSANNRVPENSISSGQNNRFLSFYGNFSYTYLNRYSVTGSVRRDASNLFGVNTNQKWSPFWSLGLGWDLISPSGNDGVIERLKMRGSVGYSGNVDPTRSGLLRIARGGIDGNTGMLFYQITGAPDYNMRWEKVRTVNVGLDFAFCRSFVQGSIDVYNKKTSDLFGYQNMDPTTGFSYQFLNGAGTSTNGLDLELFGKVGAKSLIWEPVLRFSYSKNILNKYQTIETSIATSIIPTPYFLNEIYMPMVSLPFKGLDPKNGDPLSLYKGNISNDYASIVNQVSIDDLVIHGSQIPQYWSSFTHNLRYKSFGLFLNVTGQFDYFFRRTGFNSSGITSMEIHSDYNNRWLRSGDELKTTVPSLKYPVDSNRETFYRLSEALVEPGDHIRLQDLRLDYQLNIQRWAPKQSNVQVFVGINNVLLIWKKTNIDIDPMTANSWIPAPRTISFGLKLNL